MYIPFRGVTILWITTLLNVGFSQNLQTINIREYIINYINKKLINVIHQIRLFQSCTIQNNVSFDSNIVFINDRSNLVAEETLSVTLNYIRRNPRIGLMIDGLYSVKIGGDDASAILETRMTIMSIPT